jgi:hypothetical protein
MKVAVHLPGELIEIIIGYLPDRQSIKLCSLTPRPWVPWTRVQLFSQVRLVLKNLLPFLILLQSPYCSFPCYVRNIYIRAHLVALPNSYHKTLLAVLNGPHPWLDVDTITRTRGLLHKARTSMVNVMDGSEPSHVMNLICLFPAVEHLHLQLWNFYYGIGKCSGLSPISPTLKSLTLSHGIYPSQKNIRPRHWKNLLKWAIRQNVCNISRLYLDVMAPWNLEGAQQFLKIQGSSLRHLHVESLVIRLRAWLHRKHSGIAADVSRIEMELCPLLNFSHNPQLESVHYDIGRSGSTQDAADMLSAISSNKIKTVGFDINHGLLRNAEEEWQLKRLGTIMASNNFSGVSRILIRLEYDWSYTRSGQPSDTLFELIMQSSLDVIYGAFQFARARGILEVEHLTYERRRSERPITDDCFLAKVPADVGRG